MADQQKTVITGATLVDGTGTPSRLADVAFENGVITEVGEPGTISTAHAHQHVRADGLLLTIANALCKSRQKWTATTS